ncbi:MAG: hydroxymethylbilane synthase [Verrucomicrobiae bacterium]|nr:hydroxymethylbilane synthase [Verrucomicrobiae bacterium]
MSGVDLVLGTRGSGLALTQSRWVASQLERAHPGLRVGLRVIRTRGDRLQRRGAEASPEGLPKGLFTAELERELLAGSIDLAVHSLKDLPVEDPPGLSVGAVPARASAHDVLVTRGPAALRDLPAGAVIATGSPRRKMEILRVRPDASVVPIRGNVDTRLSKLRGNAEWQAVVLAEAGIGRLGPDLSGLVVTPIPFEEMLPAPGQGALGVQIREGDARVRALVGELDHAPTRLEAGVERAFLRGIGGGCGIPLGTLARCSAGAITFSARLYGEAGEPREFHGRWAESEAPARAESMGRAAVRGREV